MFDIPTLAITAIFILSISLVIVRRASIEEKRRRRAVETQTDIRKRKQSEERAELQQLLDIWCSVGSRDSKYIAKM